MRLLTVNSERNAEHHLLCQKMHHKCQKTPSYMIAKVLPSDSATQCVSVEVLSVGLSHTVKQGTLR